VLFDLKGRRRHVVQATYLLLAILMGGGLVFFGIGGNTSGGLFDAFSDRSSSGSSLVNDRIDKAEKKLEENPQNKQALKDLVRDWYQLANEEVTDQSTYTEEGQKRLAKADDAWTRYLAVEKKKPEASLAALMVQAYGPNALNQAADAATAAEIVAQAQPSAQAYLQLTQYAAQAGQKRKAELAGQKAIDLAPKKQRSSVKAFVEQAKNPQASTNPPGQ
jgi:hypothetical protein